MKTIAQQLNIKDFPFEIKDKDERVIYSEYKSQYWWQCEYDSDSNVTYFEDFYGVIIDKRPKETITLNGIKYQRVEE